MVMADRSLTVGVLALQGDFEKHVRAFAAFGAYAHEVRTADDLQRVQSLVIPGGESTTMTLLLGSELRAEIAEFCRTHPVWGTCAGMIMLARDQSDPRVQPFGFLDMDVERNGFGRQVHSFEADLSVASEIGNAERPLHGIFIRAPRIKRCGADVRPLVWLNDEPVAVRHGHFLASSFHPELTDDLRLHKYFAAMTA
jgi:pyridoxal 5'-phosphate synthase pdxT subunit